MTKRQVDQNQLMNQLFIKVTKLTNDCIVKDAYITQLEEEIKSLSSKAEPEKEK